MKKGIALTLALALLCALCACGKKASASLLDADGEPLADYTGTLELYDGAFSAYARTALKEAAAILADREGVAVNEALDLIRKRGLTVKTAADRTQILAAAATCSGFFGDENADCALAVTDNAGRLTAIYSPAGEIGRTYAGSAIKPLSVYGPCMESGLINWSSMQEDSPVKMLETESGVSPWPTNGSGRYSYRNVAAADALAQSLNTVAVRWLQAYGAENAMTFLEENFGLDLQKERSIAAMSSADEVLGNIALGYLQAGVTVCEMAGYFAVFADGGRYVPAYTVTEITDRRGGTLYSAEPAEKTVFRETTAYLLNRMLRRVVEIGTGKDADVPGTDVVGKTGTSDMHADNWFVGVTPENTVAVRHGPLSGDAGNRAAALFAAYLKNAALESDASYPVPDGIRQGVYCTETGLLVSDACPGIAMGLYEEERTPGPCGAHQ